MIKKYHIDDLPSPYFDPSPMCDHSRRILGLPDDVKTPGDEFSRGWIIELDGVISYAQKFKDAVTRLQWKMHWETRNQETPSITGHIFRYDNTYKDKSGFKESVLRTVVQESQPWYRIVFRDGFWMLDGLTATNSKSFRVLQGMNRYTVITHNKTLTDRWI